MSTSSGTGRGTEGRPIEDVAAALGLGPEAWRPCDRRIAKVDPRVLARGRERPGAGRLVLVSGIPRRTTCSRRSSTTTCTSGTSSASTRAACSGGGSST